MSEQLGVNALGIVRIAHAPQGTDVGGHIRYDALVLPAAEPGKWATLPMTWPYKIGLLSGRMTGLVDQDDQATPYDVGDMIKVHADPGIVGINVVAVPANTKTLTVSATVIQNVTRGDYIQLPMLGPEWLHILDCDEDLSTITLETGIKDTIHVGYPIAMRRYFVGREDQGVHLLPDVGGTNHLSEWGKDTFDSSLVPPGMPICFRFFNASQTKTKTAYGDVALLY